MFYCPKFSKHEQSQYCPLGTFGDSAIWMAEQQVPKTGVLPPSCKRLRLSLAILLAISYLDVIRDANTASSCSPSRSPCFSISFTVALQ